MIFGNFSVNLWLWLAILFFAVSGYISLNTKNTTYTVAAIILAFVCGLRIYLSVLAGSPLW